MKDKYAKTQQELADEIGISKQALCKGWIHKDGWPGQKTTRGYNVRKCMEFIQAWKEAERLKKETGPNADMKARKLGLECEKLQIQIDILRGDAIPMDEHLRELGVHAGIVRGVLRTHVENCKALGLQAGMVEDLEGLADRALASIRAEIEEEAENAKD